MSNTQYYYDAIGATNGWIGRIYHYDESGNKEIVDHRTEVRHERSKAIDDAIDWADENNIEASDGT